MTFSMLFRREPIVCYCSHLYTMIQFVTFPLNSLRFYRVELDMKLILWFQALVMSNSIYFLYCLSSNFEDNLDWNGKLKSMKTPLPLLLMEAAFFCLRWSGAWLYWTRLGCCYEVGVGRFNSLFGFTSLFNEENGY